MSLTVSPTATCNQLLGNSPFRYRCGVAMMVIMAKAIAIVTEILRALNIVTRIEEQ